MMTWGRGFFRAWLVLSAIWIGLFIYFYEPVTYSWPWRHQKFDFKSPTGHQMTFDSPKTHEELAAEITAELHREADKVKALGGKTAGLPDEFVQSLKTPESIAKARDEFLTIIATDRDEAKRAWLFTIIPPLVLLGLGLSIAWIFSGFRART